MSGRVVSHQRDHAPAVVTQNDPCDIEPIETPEQREARLDAEQAYEDYRRRCEWLEDYRDGHC